MRLTTWLDDIDPSAAVMSTARHVRHVDPQGQLADR
jgi:hypothetical protein